MSNNRPTPKKLPEPTPDELKAVERAKANHAKRKKTFTGAIYPSIAGGVNAVLKEQAKGELYPIADFYKTSLVAKALDTAKGGLVRVTTVQGSSIEIDRADIKQKLASNIKALKAFYDKQKSKTLAVTYYQRVNDETAEALKPYFEYNTFKPVDHENYKVDVQRHLINSDNKIIMQPNKVNVATPINGYALTDKPKLIKAIDKLPKTKILLHKDVEIQTSVASVEANTIEGLKQLFTDVVDLAKACNIKDDGTRVLAIGEVEVSQTHLELLSTVSLTLATVQELNKPVEQTNLFSNMTVGVDTAEITGRHQFFSPMFRGFMGLGESGLCEAINVATKRSSNVTIPYETKGSSSVYKTKLQTSVDISGVEKALITDEAKAQRFTARLIKAQGILYLWAMHTNSLTIYNTKVSDMLRLAGFEGRIKPEHYIDITEGIAGLFAIAVTKTDDHYTDPKTGKKVYVGKNEMYGEVVRPIGEVQAVWHMQDKPYYYTEAEFNNLDEITRNNLDYKGEVKQEYTEVDKNGKRQNKTRQVNKYYQILTTNKSNKDKTTEAIEYEKQPAYIKQLIRLEIAKGMLNPTARRATLVSKALLRLNTLQERQYLQLGSFISDHFSQYQDRTVEGKPIRLTLQTLLEWRGLADPDNLQRVSRTKQHLQQALDKLIEIGHIAKWEIEGARYDKLGLSPDDRSRIVLIYPAQAIVEALRPVIAEPDEKLKKVLKEQVREQGATKVAEQYETTADAINGIINNRETVDSLPKKAYDDLKLKAYDKQNNK